MARGGYRVDGEALRNRRMNHGMTQAALGEAAGVSEQLVSALELDQTRASIASAAAIAQALGLTVAQAVAEGLFRLETGHPGSTVAGAV